MRRRRPTLPALAGVLFVLIGAVTIVSLLGGGGSSSGAAALPINAMSVALADLRSASPPAGGAAPGALARIRADERTIGLGLALTGQAGTPAGLEGAANSDFAALEWLARRSARHGAPAATRTQLDGAASALARVFGDMRQADATGAVGVSTQSKLADAGVVVLLLLACGFLLVRSTLARREVLRLAHEREVLLGTRRDESRTDVLTGLGNRRALADDLLHALAEPPSSAELLLAVLDLDGFKQYNDTFGHAAGDALLQRLSLRLAESVTSHAGFVYRIGGDEFCMFARVMAADAEKLLDGVTTALRDGGDGWHIGCSLGAAWIPSEAATEADALALADERMYANKAGRSSPSQQVTDALLQVLAEQSLILDDHVERVAELSVALAKKLGQSDVEARRIHLAARLHDIGKTAIPVEILNKPGPLDDREWSFIRQHPLIGERIVLAAPALAHTAPLIRASHERYDGKGYPDGLRGSEIPLGARIIAVCDAFDAMTSDRLYRRSIGVATALEQLAAHAGSHFDGAIVEAFCAATALHHVAAAAAT